MLTVYITVKLYEKYAENYITTWESFEITLPGERTVVAFCGRILALGRWNLQMSWCKCPGVPLDLPPGMAADKCIKLLQTSLDKIIFVSRDVQADSPESNCYA